MNIKNVNKYETVKIFTGCFNGFLIKKLGECARQGEQLVLWNIPLSAAEKKKLLYSD